MNKKGFFSRAHALIRKVPRGKVVTYGQIASKLGNPNAARTVGWAVHALNDPNSGVPWHRVVNAKGGISSCGSDYKDLQRKLLEAEGVKFDREGIIDLGRYGWKPNHRSGRKEKGSGVRDQPKNLVQVE